ncbi:MAG: gliding motility-associated C-terminal domain-containing protein [Saprospiraceae bacterium]|nr:gliding motility-associated C-terminal domain-containing protein [Saprospiraceae bacterium]MCF8248958.1 gliding motility-associated C-terminal domain-containing protein [Saprospiraceae bacterium]MCF8279169.1 gliding motility-associated C-terminal domain-containing protein [Bacteroidales bacterium]MCF8310852.1 gliding motility-associated C-terminal domain-containing protein [Saprospiraceae bacterium]MCF8439560.1 gliding motility-associated C-terminal domain-containing protein [Saprospiraceae 
MRNLLHTALAVLGILFALPLHATHIIGGELSYKYVGNDSFLITLDLYRDCGSLNNETFELPYANIGIFTENGLNYTGVSTTEMKLFPVGVFDTIPNNIAGDPCLFVPPSVCVQHARYQRKFRLVGSQGIYITYQRCCRNSALDNIVNPLETGASYWIYLSPNAKNLHNSSPQFGFYPPVFVCVNYPIVHPHQATDIDGDSLVYKFYTPFTGAYYDYPIPTPDQPPYGSPYEIDEIQPPPYDTVVWNDPPYNLGQLLGPSSDPLSIDPITGLITGYPSIQGRFVVGVLVEEYRNGQLLSVVRRDFQYEVGICAELDVQIVAPDAQCDDLTVHFGNNTNVAQNFIWYFDWPNLTPSSTAKEPNFTYPDTGTFIVALIAEPVGQCVDTAFHEIYLQYNSLTPDFEWETYDCSSQSVLVLHDLSTDYVSPVLGWNWTVTYDSTTLTSNLQNPVFQIPNPSSGTISLTANSVNGCEQTKMVNFTSGGNNPEDLLSDTVQICLGETTHLNPAGDMPGFTFQWAPPVPAAQQYLANPAVAPAQSTNYVVTITGYSGLCQTIADVFVEVFTPVQLAFVTDADCDGRVIHFINQSQFAPFGFFWDFGDLATASDTSSQANPTWTYPAYGDYTVTLMTAPNAACKDTIQQTISSTLKTLEPGFSYQYNGCNEDAVSIKFFDQTFNSEDDTQGWHWTFTGVATGTSTQMNPTVTVQQEGWLYVTLQVTTGENCVATTALDSLWIDLTELPYLEDGSEVIGCFNGGVCLNVGGDSTYIYHWSPAIPGCDDCPSPCANPSQTTIYTVEVVNPNGADTCTIVRQITVIVPPDVHLIGSADVQTCNTTATLTASAGMLPVTYAWFDENGMQVAGDVTSITVTVSGYDYYVVRATDPLGCHWYDTIQVVGGPVNIEAVGDQIKCSDEPLNIYATNLDLNDTLVWNWTPVDIFSGPTDVPNPTVLIVPGTRWLYVEATNQFGCSAMDSVYMAVVDTANVLDFEYLVECNGSTVQFINTSANAFNYSWDFGDLTMTDDTSHLDNPIYTYPGIGTYTVRLTMDFDLACVDTLVKDITFVSTQFIPDFTYEYLACDVDSVEVQFHDATTILQTGITIDSFFWVTSNGETSSLPAPVFTVYAGETFEVTMNIFTNNGCDGSETKDLKLDFIEINFSDSLVLCQGDSTALNPFGNTTYEYHWTPNIAISNPDVANPTVWPTQTTVYSVEITNFSPDTCSVTRTVTVFVPEKVNVAVPPDTLTCGTPVTLCAAANLQNLDYDWMALPGGFIGSGACLTVLPSADTNYEVTATDQYGCFDKDTIFVANESVKINWQQAGTECPETAVQLTVNNLVSDHNLSYVWSATPPGQVLPPAMGPMVTVVTPPAALAANYSVTVTNQYGCTKSLTQAISSYNFVPTVVENVDVCPGVGEALNPGANPNLDYVWSSGTGLSCTNCPNPTVTVSQSTIYTVTISDNFGLDQCQEVIQVNVTAAPIIQITETVDTFTCGEPIVISAQTNVVMPILTWKDEAGNPLGTQPSLTVDPDSSATYTICVTDAFGCSATDEVVVANYQLDILLDGNGVIDTCPMPNYNICVTNLDINDILTFNWTASSGGTILSGGDTACPSVTSQQGVTSNFQVLVTNQWGCSETRDFDVTTYVFDPMARDIVDICPDVPTPINPEAAASTLSYAWLPMVGLDCYDCPNPVATLDANQIYTVTILGFNGADTCSFSQTVQVRVMPKHNLTTSPVDTMLCDSIDLTLSAFYTSNVISGLAWSQSLDFSNPLATTASVTVTPHETEYYYVQTTDTLGCHDTAQVVIYAYPVDISVDDYFNFCEEIGNLTIPVINHHPEQTLTFEWSPSDYVDMQNSDGSIVVTGLVFDETFTVVATNQYGCTEEETTDISYYNIEPTLGQITSSDSSIYYNSGEFSQLNIDDLPGYTYQWTPEAGLDDPTIPNPIAEPDTTTTYTVLVTDEGDCQAFREVTIVVLNPDCDEPNLFLPNAFTPNNDGENDVLIFRSNIVEVMELAIYNRWGQRVFYSEDQSIGWDGTFKGEKLSPDVYGFYLHAKCYNGQDYFKKGNITLLR